MRFIPHTPSDIEAMLEVVGIASLDDLFADVPESLRASAHLNLPAGASEQEVRRTLGELAGANAGAAKLCFLGAGCYPHFSPAVVDHVIQRAEFYSAYTPYQPEVSQGTLQAIFEFQTMVAGLLGLEVANASMYDGASSAAEAVLMALRSRPKRNRVLLSRALHPQYTEVIRTYVHDAGDVELVEIPWAPDGRIDAERLRAAASDATAAVVVGYPNVFGIVEDLGAIAAVAAEVGALTISATAESLALGVLRSPGELGADIAVAEGQSFGIPMSYGGPGVGLFATRTAHLRSMPGRLVGQTVDGDGRRAFVLTLATREQHIRREKATSNICTNHSLIALAATVYLATLGRRGLRAVACENLRAAHRVADRLCARGWKRRFDAPFFNEVVLERSGLATFLERARGAGVLPGLPLERWYPDLRDCLLVCATEVHSESDVDRLAEVLA